MATKLLLPENDPKRFETGCLGKDHYPSEQAAWAVITMAKHEKGKKDLNKMRMPEMLEAYQCMFTRPDEPPHWHIGHV